MINFGIGYAQLPHHGITISEGGAFRLQMNRTNSDVYGKLVSDASLFVNPQLLVGFQLKIEAERLKLSANSSITALIGFGFYGQHYLPMDNGKFGLLLHAAGTFEGSQYFTYLNGRLVFRPDPVQSIYVAISPGIYFMFSPSDAIEFRFGSISYRQYLKYNTYLAEAQLGASSLHLGWRHFFEPASGEKELKAHRVKAR